MTELEQSAMSDTNTVIFRDDTVTGVKMPFTHIAVMVNGPGYYRALESVSTASATLLPFIHARSESIKS